MQKSFSSFYGSQGTVHESILKCHKYIQYILHLNLGLIQLSKEYNQKYGWDTTKLDRR